MTDLVERYLNAIKPLLPHGQQEDITAELRDEIQSRIEDKEAELGRKLKPAEVEAILKSLGSPMQVAARYGANRYLIGPMVFPAWWLALRTLLTLVLIAVAAGGIIRTAVGLARGEPRSVAESLMQMFGDLWVAGIFVVGLVTVVAAVIERVRPDLLEGDWLMESLSRAPKGLAQPPSDLAAAIRLKAETKARAKAERRARSPTQTRVEGAFGVVFNLIFFTWLAALIEAPGALPDYLTPEPWLEATGLAFAPVWRETLFMVVLLGVAARALLHLAMLLWPRSQRRFAAAKLLCDGAGLAFAVLVLQAGSLFVAAPGLAGDARVGEVLRGINLALRLSSAILVVILALDGVYRLWRLFGPRALTPPARSR